MCGAFILAMLRAAALAFAIRSVLCAERAPSSDYLPQVFLEQWPHLHKHEKLLHLLTVRERAGYARDFSRFDSDEDGFATIDEARLPRSWYGATPMTVHTLRVANSSPQAWPAWKETRLTLRARELALNVS